MSDELIERLRNPVGFAVLHTDAMEAIKRIEDAEADAKRWKDLTIRAYKEMFTIDQDRSDHKVWIEIEDLYEENPD